MNLKTAISLVLALILAVPTFAQAPAAPPAAATATAAEAMARVHFLLGRWEGDGQFRTGPGEPRPAHVTEWIHAKLDGQVILLEGHGTAPGPDGASPVTVHEAFAVLSYDTDAGRYLLRAFKGDGKFVDADVEVGERRLLWGFATPQGRVRYTLTLDEEGKWNELGEFSRDGAAWSGFFDMTLSRVGEP